MLTSAGSDARVSQVVSDFTKFKISQSNTGFRHSEATKTKMSQNMMGALNRYYQKSLPARTLQAAKLVK